MRSLEKNKALKITGLALLISVCLAVPAYFIYQSAKGLIIDELNKNAVNIATTAASFIEQDISAYKKLPSSSYADFGSFDKKYYDLLLDRFEKIKTESGAAYIFTEKRMQDNGKAYILDGSAPRPQGPALGSSKLMTQEESLALSEGIKTRSGLMWDKAHGEFITGYAPIIDDKTGAPVGIVGVEFTLTYAQKITTGIRNIIIVSFFVIMLLATFAGYSLMNSRRRYFKEDYLTGLFNKRFFEKDLVKVMRYIRKSGRKLTLMMIDVDSFKTINDSMGHAVGDWVLKSVAKRMLLHIRGGAMCCRYGGDEFVVIQTDTDKSQAYEIAERIRREMTNLELTTEDGENISVSLSIGIAEYDNTQSAENLVECADKAMYISKNSGRNRTTVYKEAEAA